MQRTKRDGPEKAISETHTNASVSRVRTSSLVRSNSSASLREARAATVKRSDLLRSSEGTEEMIILSPEGEAMLHDGVLALNLELMEQDKKTQLLQRQDEIMSQLLYLENKAVEKKQELVDITKKFTKLKTLVSSKENCDRLIPEYKEIADKLEAMRVSTNLSELFTTLDLMHSQVQAVNVECFTVQDLSSYEELRKELEADVNYLKRLRVESVEPLLEETNRALELLSDNLERLESLKAEIKKLNELQRVRDIQAGCIEREVTTSRG